LRQVGHNIILSALALKALRELGHVELTQTAEHAFRLYLHRLRLGPLEKRYRQSGTPAESAATTPDYLLATAPRTLRGNRSPL